MRQVEVCALSDLDEPGSRGFSLQGEGGAVDLFVVLKDDQVYAYRNSCPHTGAPLEWMPDQFLDLDKYFIQCAMHGALFRVEDGYCLSGPCAGQSLQPLEVRVQDGTVWVSIADPEPVATG